MPMIRQRVLDIATLLLAICALAVAGPAVAERLLGITEGRDRRVDDWHRFTDGNLRLGAEEPLVTIVEWGDYQCPGCRSIAPRLERIIEEFTEVALVYRHWPLPYHSHAYIAARAAECAASQGRFQEIHAELMRTNAWMNDPPKTLLDLAESIDLPDPVAFEICLLAEEPHPAIENDIVMVREELGGKGTPTIMVNDLLLGTLPDSTKLQTLVEEAIREARSR